MESHDYDCPSEKVAPQARVLPIRPYKIQGDKPQYPESGRESAKHNNPGVKIAFYILDLVETLAGMLLK